MYTFKAAGLQYTDDMVNQFIKLHDESGGMPSKKNTFPAMCDVRCELTDVVEEYLGDYFIGVFNVLDGLHGSYGPHIDNPKGSMDILCRLNILLCGHGGQIEYYTDDCIPNLSKMDDAYWLKANAMFQDRNVYQSIWDFADPGLEIAERVKVDYPSFIRTDKVHSVSHNPKHKKKRRLVLSVPFIGVPIEQLSEHFNEKR